MAVKTYTSGDLATSNQYIKMRLQVVVNSQSVENNTSSLTVRLYARRTNTGYTTYGSGTATVTVGGTTLSQSITPSQKIVYSSGNGICLLEKSVTVSHNSDGSRSLTVTGQISIPSILQSDKKSYTVSLPVIPRASSFSLSSSSVAVGNAVTVTIKKQDDGFSHRLIFSLGSCESTVSRSASGNLTESFSFTVPKAALDAMPRVTKASATLALETLRGSTVVGRASKTLTVTVPSSVAPSISGFSLSGTGQKAGALLMGYAKVSVKASVQPGDGASLKTITLSGGGLTASLPVKTAVSYVSSVIKTAGNHSITLAVTDSRGRMSKKSATVPVLAYEAPVITSLSARRMKQHDGVWQEDDAGTGLFVTAKWRITKAGSNRDTVTVQFGPKGGTLQTFTGTLLSGQETALSETASAESVYEVVLTVKDSVGNQAQKKIRLPTRRFAWDVKREAAGIAFGKTAEEADCTDLRGYKKTYLPNLAYMGGEAAPEQKNLYFTSPEGSENVHSMRFYGGGATSTTGIGMNDDKNDSIVWRYDDVEKYMRFYFPSYHNGMVQLKDQLRFLYGVETGWTAAIWQPSQTGLNFGIKNGASKTAFLEWYGEVEGDQRFLFRPTVNGQAYLGSSNYRWNTGYFTNTITQSDKKDKENIAPLDGKAIEFIRALMPVSYTLKNGEGGRTHLGLIAQEVAKTAKETGMGDLSLYQAARVDENGNESRFSSDIPDEELSWGLNYAELIAPLLYAVQQLYARVEALENREAEKTGDSQASIADQELIESQQPDETGEAS